MEFAPVQQKQTNVSSQDFPAIPAAQLFAASLQAIQGDSSAAGTIKIQASNDFSSSGNAPGFVPTNWSDISGLTVTITGGAIGFIPKFDVSYQWLRAVWTQTTPGSTTVLMQWNVQDI